MKNQLSEEIRNPELIEAMAAVNRHNTEKTRGHMAAVLMNSRLLSPIQKQTVLTEKEGPSTRIKFEDIQNVEGDKYYLAFTDMDEYAKWNKDGKHDHALIMTMEDFGNILIRNIHIPQKITDFFAFLLKQCRLHHNQVHFCLLGKPMDFSLNRLPGERMKYGIDLGKNF